MVAFVIGALTGAAVALLFAPATGEETREFLGQKAREGKAKARDAMDQGRDYYSQPARQPRHRRRARPRRLPAGARAGRPGVSETGELFLGIIAFAVMVMASSRSAPSSPGSVSPGASISSPRSSIRRSSR